MIDILKNWLLSLLLSDGENAMILRLRQSAKLTERINEALDWSEGQWMIAMEHTMWTVDACTRFSFAAMWTPTEMERAQWVNSLSFQKLAQAEQAAQMSNPDFTMAIKCHEKWKAKQMRLGKKNGGE